MAEASKTVVMSVTPEQLWKVISDYEKYAEFVDGVNRVKIKSREKGKIRVEYAIELIGKEILYTLDHFESPTTEMHWDLVDSNIMKGNSGGWKLKDLGGGKTEVTYSLALEFKIFVPGMILNGLVKSTLPKMLEGFEARVRSTL